MSEDIKVSFAAIATLASDIQRESAEVQNHLDTLESEASRLRANWDGQAQMAFDSAKRDWDKEMENMHVILTDLSGKVDDAGAQYRATEARNASRFG